MPYHPFTESLQGYLAEHPELAALLVEAEAPLAAAFGGEHWIAVTYWPYAGGLVRACIELPAGSVQAGESALQAFDKAWWVQVCARAGGALVFDYCMAAAEEEP